MNDVIKQLTETAKEYWLTWEQVDWNLNYYSEATRRPCLAMEAIDSANNSGLITKPKL